MSDKKIVLGFKDSVGSKHNVTISDVKDDPTAAEMKSIMDYIMTTGVIVSKKGTLIAKVSGTTVDTAKTEYKL